MVSHPCNVTDSKPHNLPSLRDTPLPTSTPRTTSPTSPSFPKCSKRRKTGSSFRSQRPTRHPLVNYAPQQTGGWVLAIVKDPKKYIGKRVDAISEYVTVGEWAKILSEVIGKPVRTNGIPENIFDDYSFLTGMGIPEELILNYKAFHEK